MLPDGEHSHIRVLATPCNTTFIFLFLAVKQNNSVDDVLGFIVCAQGGVRDMTGVINDHALCLA